MMPATIAWIGLGKLGLPIAARLAGAGHAVRGVDPDPARRELAAGRGIRAGEGLAEAVDGAGFVFLSLPDDRTLAGLVVEAADLRSEIRPDGIVVETSTVSPEVSARCAEALAGRVRGYLRAPVSGNPVLAEAGTLTSFLSGPRDSFEAARPLLDAYCRSVAWLGEGEQARYAKLAINLMIAVSAGMIGEALTLGVKGGIERGALLDLMAESAVGSPMVKYKTPPLKEEDYASTFSCRQMAKDLDLILGACRSVSSPAPLSALMREAYSTLLATGSGEDDYIANVRQAEIAAGLAPPSSRASASGRT